MVNFSEDAQKLRVAGFDAKSCLEFLEEHSLVFMLKKLDNKSTGSKETQDILDIFEGLIKNERSFEKIMFDSQVDDLKALFFSNDEDILPKLARGYKLHSFLIQQRLIVAQNDNPELYKQIIWSIFHLMKDEMVDCFAAVSFCLFNLASTSPSVLISEDFFAGLKEVLEHKNSVLRIRGLELTLNLSKRSEVLLKAFNEKDIINLAVETYAKSKDDILAKLNIIESFKLGTENPKFLQILIEKGFEEDFTKEALNPSTDLYLRRDLTVLVLAIQRYKSRSKLEIFDPFYVLCKKFLSSKGEEFDSGVEIAIHLFDYLEIYDFFFKDSDFLELVMGDRMKEGQKVKLRELKLHMLLGEKFSIDLKDEVKTSVELFQKLIRLFYGKNNIELSECIENLLEGCYAPFDDVELGNLKVLNKLISYNSLFDELLKIKSVEKFTHYLNTLKGKNPINLELKRSIRKFIIDKIQQMKEENKDLKKYLDALLHKEMEVPEVNTEAN